MIKKISGLFLQEGFRKYLANTSWMLGEKVIRLLVGLLVAAMVARYLGVENYGILNYAISLVLVLTSFASLGLDEIVVSKLVQEKDHQKKLLGTSFVLRVFASILAILFTILFVYQISESPSNRIYIIIIAGAVIFQPFNVIDYLFQSQVKAKYLVMSSLVSLLFGSCLRLYFIYIKAPLINFVWVVFIEAAFLAIGLVFFYLKKNRNFSGYRFSLPVAKSLLSSSLPLIISTVTIAVYMKIDQIIIKKELDVEAVGNYSAASRISELWYFIPMALGSALFPALLNAKKMSEELYKSRLQQLYDIMTLMSVAIAILVTIFSTYIIQFLFGPTFTEAPGVLSIHIWAGIFVFIGVTNSKFTIIENITKIALIRTIMGVCLNITLNLILIPRFGIKGAAFTTLISQFFSSYLSMVFWKRNRPAFYLATRSLNVISAGKRLIKSLQ